MVVLRAVFVATFFVDVLATVFFVAALLVALRAGAFFAAVFFTADFFAVLPAAVFFAAVFVVADVVAVFFVAFVAFFAAVFVVVFFADVVVVFFADVDAFFATLLPAAVLFTATFFATFEAVDVLAAFRVAVFADDVVGAFLTGARFLPPPSCLLTVAQAMRSAASSPRPCSFSLSSMCSAWRFCLSV
ncbi:hypothetical protein [Stenotrophomonas sp. P5_B8]